MRTFWALFGIDTFVVLVLYFFLLTGLGDGSVSSDNIAIWLLLTCIPTAVLCSALGLKKTGRPGLAKGLLALLALPGLLIGGWMLLLIVLFAANPGGHH